MANQNLVINIQHPAAISNNVRYARIDNTSSPSYQYLDGIGNGMLTIPNLPNGQYFIGVTPIYADGRSCLESTLTTPPCTGIVGFSAILQAGNILVNYSVNISVPYLQVNITYPNGGAFNQQYVNSGTGNLSITPPAGVYGQYTVTIQAVCDQQSGFLSAPSAPAYVTVPAPNNSTVTNNTAGPLAPISITGYTTTGNIVLLSLLSLAGSGGNQGFYVPDGLYTSIVINYGSGTVAGASLATGSGTYPGVLGTGTITFSNVNSFGGDTIAIH